MARTFTSTEAKRLIEQHKDIQSSLTKIKRISSSYENEIREAAKALVGREVLEQLKNVPIEEINREKRGFKTKLLREHGYCTLADISSASVYSIASIYGISENTAYSIHHVVRGLVDQTSKNTKIRLSLDNKSTEATRLIIALSKYRQVQPYVESARQLTSSHNRKVGYALEDLQPGTGGLSWFFTSGRNKQKAEEAFRYLTELLSSDYAKEAECLQQEIFHIDQLQGSEGWKDFSENSIRFFNILESISPGILGTDDAVYGLPEELAREIQEECFFPDGLLCELRRYQEWGVKYILHQERVLLGDEMGLGKTVQAIATMVSLKNTGATHFVVVCPASVISNWCREIRRHSLLSVTKVHGTGRTSALKSWIKTGGVVVTTYETTGFFVLESDFRFTLLVVDEAHYIKNPEARRTINVKTIGNHADRMLFMTGTALENKVDEMISLIRILQPNVAAQVQSMAFLSSAPRFRERVAPVYYRRKREDVLTELPELIESKEWCVLSGEEEQVYEASVLGKHYAEARRVSWSVDDLHKSSKAKRLLELIDEAESDDRKTIVFSYFLDTIRKICDLLEEKCMNPINGSVSPNRRQEIIDEFENAPAGTVLPAQIQAGGTGLNIQTASVVILCEPQFKPSIENQAISRAYRMGQTRNVLVYRLLCEDTVDEKIISMLEEKQKIFDAFADKSVAAAESIELDEKGFGDIIKEEIDRINAKHGNKASDATS